MYCLEKLQRELAHFLDIDLRDLPKVQEILQSQGYTAVKKNDEIIELGQGKQGTGGEVKRVENNKSESVALSGRAYPQQQLTPFSNGETPSTSSLPSRVLDLGSIKEVENNKSESVALSGRAYPQQQLTPFSNGETPSTSSLPSRVLDLGSIKESGLNKTKDKVLHLINKLRDILDKPIINHSSGLSGILTKSSLNKIASDKAVQKSIQNGFSKEEHFKSAEYIKELFENAILRTTHADSKGRESIEAVHRFVTPLKLNDKEANALITLLEKKQGNNKIYTIELEGLEARESIEAVHRFVTPLKLNDKEANALITLLEKKQGNNKIYTIELEGLEANKEVLLKNAKANPYPHNADEVAKSESISNPSLEQGYPQQYHLSTAYSTTNNLKWQQDGNVLRSVVELDNGEKLLLSKDRLGNVYIQSNFKEQINSYDELMLQESLEKFAKDELENKLARQIETKPLAQEVDSVILSGSEKSHSKKDTSAKPQYDKGEEQGYDKQKIDSSVKVEPINEFGENYPQFYHKPHEAIKHLLETKSGQVQGAFYREKIDSSVKVEPINEFGENYPQFYHKPHEAIKHLLETKSGQVQGAFYRDEIGDITLAWGEKGTGKSDGWGLAKIAEYHPEVIDKLDELVQNLPIVKENANRYQLENDMYKLSIRKDFEGQKENWILTAFEKDESIARRRTDLPSSQSEAEKTTSANAKDIIPQTTKEQGKSVAETKELIRKNKELESAPINEFGENYPQFYHKPHEAIKHLLETKSGQVQGAFYREELGDIDLVWPINEFGENYPQFYHKPHEAIKHLLETKSGQVQGAFYREELGDIDLVWGNEKIGLQKIVDKHLKDFTDFAGNNPYEKMSNAINEIIENGKLLTENGVNTLYLQKDNKTFLVGLSKGWHDKGENQWIITSYEAKNLKADMLEKIGANKTISADESLNALQTFNATDDKGENQWIITSYEAKNLKADMLEKIGANKTISADESLNALQTFNATDKNIIPQKRNKAGIAKLDSTQIQSQIQKEAKAQQEAADYFAKTQAKRDENIIPQKRNKAGIAKLDSTQIQSQIQKEAKAQQEAADYFAKTQAKRDEIIALKEAKLGKNADEVPLDKGQDILYKPIRDTSIVLNDESTPFEAEFAVVKLSDIKPNFDNSNTQGRLIKQESVIANIVNDFKPELIFYQEGGVNGVPIITRDGKVVSGNHRSEALKQIFNSQTHNAEIAQQKYKQGAKEFLGVELENDEIIVRRLKENMSDKQILQLAFSSNIGRESTMGEKALSTLSLYRQNIATLPKALQSENVNELKSLVAKHIDKQSNGLNTFEPNLALLTSLARNGKNSNILQSLDSIKGNAEYKNKIINMYVDNAGSFYNLAHNPSFKNLEFRDILSDAIFYTAKQNPTRELDYTHLINDIESFLNLAKDKQALNNALVLDSNKVENLTAQAFGVALAKFSRQENPSSALYECLKEAPKALELATQPTFFTQGKALSEVDIYDFLEYLINQGQVTQSQSALSSLMPRLRELRESMSNPQSSVSKAESSLESTSQKADSNDIIFTDKKGKEHTLTKEVQEQWLNTFNLKSLDESYTPKHSDEIKEALGGKEIKLQLGSLKKLVAQGREKYIPQIKEVLDSPEVILKDSDNAFLFARHLKDDDYFVNVSVDKGEYLVSISNGIKETSNIKNKLDSGAEVIYQSPNANSNLQTLLQTSRYSANKIDSDIIPYSTKLQSNAHLGSGLVGGSVAGIESDENGNITFSPEKFALGLLGGAAGSKAVMSGKYAIMRRMEARNKDKKLYNVFKAIDSSAKYGSKMNLVGKENLNADTLAYALAKNKRFAINKLDENTAKVLGFKYPQDVRRTIQPDEIIHTLTRHGENSDLARLSGQKPVTLDEIAKYQDYADNAQVKQESKDKSNNRVLISVGQLDNGFLVVIEQIRKGQNELGYKNMYFEKGILNDETLTRIFKK